MASVPHGVIAAERRPLGSSVMASHALEVPATSVVSAPAVSLPRTLTKLPLLAIMVPVWLVMLAFAAVLLVATLVHDALALVLRGSRPAPIGVRRPPFLASIF